MKNNLKPSLFDIPILLIFFTRPKTFKEVFKKIKQIRPSKIFLACDGPRENHPEDMKLINECKKIVEDIDWDCEIYQNYAENNMGCGMRPQTAINWAFNKTNKLIVLEDDCVPHGDFFSFMKEMLEKYENDERIGLVCGFNHFLNWDCGDYSYFYTKNGPMAGAWGTWKRVWDRYDYNIKNIEIPLIKRLIYDEIAFRRAKSKKINLFERTKKELEKGKNISYWDVQFGYLKYVQSFLSIVPKYSLVSNIGLGIDSTHAKNIKNIMPSIFFSKERKLKFPLNHPDFVICDREYDNKVDKIWGFPNPIIYNIQRGVRLIKKILRLNNTN